MITSGTSVSRRHLLKLGLGSVLGAGLAVSGVALFNGPESNVSAAPPVALAPSVFNSSTSLKSNVTTFLTTPPPPTPYPPTITPPPHPMSPPTAANVPPLPPFQAYHGVNGATHQGMFNTLSGQGYRMISLSIYGDPNDPRYAAVWVQMPGPAYIAMHGITADEYQSRFNSATAQGYAPVLVSATGSANNARFAAVFEQGVQGAWKARHGIDANTYDFETVTAVNDNLVPTAIAIYGDASARRYAAVWHSNTEGIDWPTVTDVTPAAYQQSFNSLNSHGYYPRYVAVAADQNLAAVFGGNDIGAWIARHNLTAAQYQQAFNDATTQGYIPISVQGGGIGDATRYAAVFATRLL